MVDHDMPYSRTSGGNLQAVQEVSRHDGYALPAGGQGQAKFHLLEEDGNQRGRVLGSVIGQR